MSESGGPSNAPPRRKKIDIPAYLASFEIKNKEKEVQTHMWMAGKYNGGRIHLLHVPPDRRLEFYTTVGEWINSQSIDDLQHPYGGENCITEKIYIDVFRLYLDIDFKIDLFKDGIFSCNKEELHDQLRVFLGIIFQVVQEHYGELTYDSYVAMRLPYKIHIHFPSIVVNKVGAQALTKRIKEALATDDFCATVLNADEKCVDEGVYNTGIRMLYMHKGRMGKNKGNPKQAHKEVLPWCFYNEIYTLVDKQTFTRLPFNIEDFKRCSILPWEMPLELTVPNLPFPKTVGLGGTRRKQQAWEHDDDPDDPDEPEVIGQPAGEDLIKKIKRTLDWAFKEFNHIIKEDKAKISSKGRLILPLGTKECKRIGREHQSNHQFLSIDHTGARQKCTDCKVSNKIVPLKSLPDSVKRELKELKIVKEYNVVQRTTKITDEERRVTFKDALSSEPTLFPRRNLSLINTENVFYNGVSFSHRFQERWCELCQKEHDQPSTIVTIDGGARLYATCLECMQRNDYSVYPSPPKNLGPDWRNFYVINVYVNNACPQDGHGDVDLVFQQQKLEVFTDPVKNDLAFHALSGTTFAIAKLFHYVANKEFNCTLERKWYAYRQHRWVPDANSEVLYYFSNTLIKDFWQMRDTYDDHITDPDLQRRCHNKITQICNDLASIGFKEKLLKEAEGFFYTDDVYQIKELDKHFEHRLDENKHLIGFTNGVYDLTEMEFRDGLPEDCITMSVKYPLPSEPDPVKRAEIMQFFHDIQPDDEDREYMLLHLASCLHGENIQEHYHVYTGSGRNGKSKLQDLLKGAFGDYFASRNPELLTRDRVGPEAASANTISLKGKRLVVVSEPNPNEKFKGNVIKQLTGNDTLSGRGLYSGKSVEFVPHFQLICLTNDIPLMDVTDDAIFLRSRIIHFPTRFTSNPTEPHEKMINEQLQDSIKEWHGDFMLLLLDYYAKYKNELGKKLLPPRSVLKMVELYKQSSNPVSQWWNESTEVQVGYNSCLKSFQNKFKEWYKDNYNKSMDSNKFNLELGRLLPKDGQIAHIYCHDKQTVQKGVPNRRMKPEHDDHPDD